MTNPLLDNFRKGMIRAMVQKAIFCTVSGDLLDIRTCVVVLDADGDPAAVFSPEGYRIIKRVADDKGANPLASGYTFDSTTLPKE